MGVSTNAILVFGIDLGEELPESWIKSEDEDEFDFDNYLAEKAGHPPWREDMSEPERQLRWKNIREIVGSSPVSLLIHCSCDYPMYILAVNGTEISASRGYPEEILDSNLSVDQVRIQKFKEWVINSGIGWSEPKWYLCSMWC